MILMIVGAAGLVLSMLFWSSWGGFDATAQTTTVVRDDVLPALRQTRIVDGAGASAGPVRCDEPMQPVDDDRASR